ncbi:hypothetical protein F5Y16DRAFT_366846 [Xylariaceae sp. FL0255]|nr:hypothetical protein F5Y16DRAFT_366846 [Xylariaceae sp. FL0255]
MSSFSFSFSGEDIEDDGGTHQSTEAAPPPATSASAFPVVGKPLLPAIRHDIADMMAKLPSKIAYSLLDVDLDGQGSMQLPRRELWDVRVQLMAEDDGETEAGLGVHDVKTGVYEGGFKSWESSVDLVKVLATSRPFSDSSNPQISRIVELGCGTALPSLALFQWAMASDASPLSFTLADYNPTVLQLVTLPNFILAWALHHRERLLLLQEAFYTEGELDLTPDVHTAFLSFLEKRGLDLLFFSGGWSPEFVNLFTNIQAAINYPSSHTATVILGAETIYSPFALSSFLETIFALAQHEKSCGRLPTVLVGAKKLYFGVGGSLDDFVVQARERGAIIEQLREETEGVRRGVVRCTLP